MTLCPSSSASSLSSSSILLKLPKELLLHDILIQYCTCETLGNLWLAFCTSNLNSDRFWGLLKNVVNCRHGRLGDSRQGVFSSLVSLTGSPPSPLPTLYSCDTEARLANVVLKTRHLSKCLVTLEYCERIPDVLWCGHMEFRDPMLPDWTTQHARVCLRVDDDSQSWSPPILHGWNSVFPLSIKVVSQMYNFIPVKPRGRLLGISDADKATIQDIRQRLARRDQVMTLRFRNDDGFILRIISPEQAKQRLERFYRGGTLKDGFETFSEGLLCCWEYNCDYEQYPSKYQCGTEEQLSAISRTLRRYQQMTSDQ